MQGNLVEKQVIHRGVQAKDIQVAVVLRYRGLARLGDLREARDGFRRQRGRSWGCFSRLVGTT